MQFFLAETLHRTLAEIREMSVVEFQGWVAWFELKAKRHKDGK